MKHCAWPALCAMPPVWIVTAVLLPVYWHLIQHANIYLFMICPVNHHILPSLDEVVKEETSQDAAMEVTCVDAYQCVVMSNTCSAGG